MRTLAFALVLLIVCAGCGGPESSPFFSPVAPPAPPATTLVEFTDTATGATTTDVRDAQEQIVRFNTAGELIWTVNDVKFADYPIDMSDGYAVGDGRFEVLFGSQRGERRAYLTHSMSYHHYDPPPIVVDLEVVDGQLIVSDERPPVPLPGS